MLAIAASFVAKYPQTQPFVEKWLLAAIEQKRASAMTYSILGDFAARRKAYIEAAARYERALSLAPKNILIKNNLAFCLGESPHFLDRALELSQQCVGKGSKNPNIVKEILLTHGGLLVKSKRWQEGIDVLKRAAELDPERSAIHENLTVAYKAIGNLALAQEHHKLAQAAE